MLVELAIADAYASGFEFSDFQKIKACNNLMAYLSHDLYGFTAKYTDDTQMSIAIAEMLVNGCEWTELNVADKLVQSFRRDPRNGYSKGFYELLISSNSGKDLISKLNPKSERNGAAIRSAPIGFLKSKKEIVAAATVQAKVTHNTSIAINSSCAVALSAHFGLHCEGKLLELDCFLEREGFGEWDYLWRGTPSVEAYETVSAALTCVRRNDKLSALLVDCTALGGDTDSVSAIAISIATCFDEYIHDLPAHLIDGLNEPHYGISFLADLDKKLERLYL
ncbi:ADP-ribosylglycohydrolase family protein [Cellvibrio sp. KY-GH-1]|uniref:ADP-ribosylglycohydrolase family protein n=1 Tax=Cellvibrio sp. KY-GH-1 TaxID=2303332 RepID=UPI001245CA60|nr:ADP-ribosylglycohydrolase family protein [Cellvibrio sp. KY-GH-1]QEY18571.1 ADP-ribosylglycohydrolase family protein [Cellvibrio sp. KY-GH-1]